MWNGNKVQAVDCGIDGSFELDRHNGWGTVTWVDRNRRTSAIQVEESDTCKVPDKEESIVDLAADMISLFGSGNRRADGNVVCVHLLDGGWWYC
jgi:hypothetical protein